MFLTVYVLFNFSDKYFTQFINKDTLLEYLRYNLFYINDYFNFAYFLLSVIVYKNVRHIMYII